MKQISDLLSIYPLYRKIKIEDEYLCPNSLVGQTFSFHCDNCNDTRTFELNSFPMNATHNYNPMLPNWGLDIIHDHMKNLFWVQQYKGECKFCKIFHCDILINAFQVKQEFFLRKIGQYPPYSIKPNKVVSDYLAEEDRLNYEKALMCYSQSYGIGSYAYFRRIVENEIKRIITDISALESIESKKIQESISKYEQNHQMATLIDEIYPFLPGSLKELGDNPLRVLYEQLSIGIHGLSEDECLEKASLLDTLLTFVIQKISEENSDVIGIKATLKKLKK